MSFDARKLRAELDAEPPVHYDVAEGLSRHRRMVASGAELPSWAADLPAPKRPSWRSRVAWIVGALSLGLVLRILASNDEQAQPRVERSPVEAAQGRAVAVPSVTQLEPTETSASAKRAARAPLQAAEATPEAVAIDVSSAARLKTVAPVVSALPAPAGVPERAAAASSSAHGRMEGAANKGARGKKARPDAESPQANEEMRQLREAEDKLTVDPVHTLKLVRAGEQAFQHGYFSQERRYLEVMALFGLHRRAEAHAHAAWFLRDYPDGPYRHKVELAVLKYPLH